MFKDTPGWTKDYFNVKKQQGTTERNIEVKKDFFSPHKFQMRPQSRDRPDFDYYYQVQRSRKVTTEIKNIAVSP